MTRRGGSPLAQRFSNSPLEGESQKLSRPKADAVGGGRRPGGSKKPRSGSVRKQSPGASPGVPVSREAAAALSRGRKPMEKFSVRVGLRPLAAKAATAPLPEAPPRPSSLPPLKYAARPDRFPGFTDHPRTPPLRGPEGDHQGPRRALALLAMGCPVQEPSSAMHVVAPILVLHGSTGWKGNRSVGCPFCVSLQAPTCLIWCPGVVCEKMEERLTVSLSGGRTVHRGGSNHGDHGQRNL